MTKSPCRVEFSHADACCHIQIHRPQARNALDSITIAALLEALTSLQPRTRLVRLSGVGKVFCAGADLLEMQQSIQWPAEKNQAQAKQLATLFATIANMPQIMIAHVQGAAIGGGAGLLACCDYVVSEAQARIGFTEARLGLAPAIIAPYVIERIGLRQARQLFLTAELLDGQRAHAIGLVDAVFDAENPEEGLRLVAEFQNRILANSPNALAAIKHLLRKLCADENPQHHSLCQSVLMQLRTSEQGQEGLQAFFQKRRPNWHVSP